MADKKLVPAAAGMLFGKPLIAELCKNASSCTTLNKVENSLKWIFQPSGVFRQARAANGPSYAELPTELYAEDLVPVHKRILQRPPIRLQRQRKTTYR